MAVEARRFSARIAGRQQGFRSGGGIGGGQGLMRQAITITREASPWFAAAIVAAAPFVAHGIGQARLGRAQNQRMRLLKQIERDRVEITLLRDRLRTVLAPDNLARWAAQHGMEPTSDVVQLGTNANPTAAQATSNSEW